MDSAGWQVQTHSCLGPYYPRFEGIARSPIGVRMPLLLADLAIRLKQQGESRPRMIQLCFLANTRVLEVMHILHFSHHVLRALPDVLMGGIAQGRLLVIPQPLPSITCASVAPA